MAATATRAKGPFLPRVTPPLAPPSRQPPNPQYAPDIFSASGASKDESHIYTIYIGVAKLVFVVVALLLLLVLLWPLLVVPLPLLAMGLRRC